MIRNRKVPGTEIFIFFCFPGEMGSSLECSVPRPRGGEVFFFFRFVVWNFKGALEEIVLKAKFPFGSYARHLSY